MREAISHGFRDDSNLFLFLRVQLQEAQNPESLDKSFSTRAFTYESANVRAKSFVRGDFKVHGMTWEEVLFIDWFESVKCRGLAFYPRNMITDLFSTFPILQVVDRHHRVYLHSDGHAFAIDWKLLERIDKSQAQTTDEDVSAFKEHAK